MTLQKVLSRVRQAVADYHMIEEGDRIAVGISGGKDSLTLLLALYELSKFYPKHFTVIAVTVNLGFQNLNLNEIRTLCADRNIPYTVVETSIAQIVFEDRKEDNPCSLCAISLPRNLRVIFTLSPLVRNFLAAPILVFRSLVSILGESLISLISMTFCFFFASFSFLTCSYLYLP